MAGMRDLDTVLAALRRRGAVLVNVGHGRDEENRRRAAAFVEAWDGEVGAVVSFSLGDTAVFRFGNTENRGRPYTDVDLESGDLFAFGGPSRMAYHGITRVLSGTGAPDLGLAGRINITLRESGF